MFKRFLAPLLATVLIATSCATYWYCVSLPGCGKMK